MEDIENYEVTSIIGSGSFGTCYKIRHKSSLEEYVWKAVNYGQMSEEKKQLLVSEVNLLSKLRHPNIVRYFDHIIHHKSAILYIIMECCSGGDLSKVIKHCQSASLVLEEVFVWRILYQLASALDLCHSRCASIVLHRDIKPANVFLDSGNNVKLGDFGLAKILDVKQSFTSTVVGTPLYMSPEVVRNKKYNKKSDIWALGCVIYEACALTPPFTGTDTRNLSENIKTGQYERIPTFYSSDLHKMVQFLLNLNCETRPTVDAILRHPTVLSKSSKTVKSIYKKQDALESCQTINKAVSLDVKFGENLQTRLENLKNRESVLKIREEKLKHKERELIKKEKKVALMERLANEKVSRANLYLKRSKDGKSSVQLREELDTSCSADPGDTSILPTSTKLNENDLIRPKGFVRSKSERKVHFNAGRIFETNLDTDVVFKEYNFFTTEAKNSKKFALKHWNRSNSSLGSKSSSNNSEKVPPISWTEVNKKSAFTLLKMMKEESNKENIQTGIPHTKM
ncbi:Nek2 [Carabus blaptoides fortunei]